MKNVVYHISWVAGAAVGLSLSMSLAVRGQQPKDAPAPAADHAIDRLIESNPELAKRIARDRDGALKADPKQLAQAKIDAARACLESNFKNFLAGRGSV